MAEFTAEQWQKMTNLERVMASHLQDLPYIVQCEYRFHDKRRWRFDFALPRLMIAIECEGGTYSGGRHTRGTGFANDCVKYNAAAVLGWVVLRFDSKQIKNGVAINTVSEAVTTQIRRKRVLSNLIDSLPTECNCAQYWRDIDEADPNCVFCYIGETEIMEARELL